MNDKLSSLPDARPSSTVLLARGGSSGPEILMVERHRDVAFGATYAFPGGVLETADVAARAFCQGLDDHAASDCLGVASNGLDYYSAAIRELFEETGVLLARHGDGRWAFAKPQVDQDALCRLRERYVSGAERWEELLAANALHLAVDVLNYVSHWETPIIRAKRFSTRFFVTELPPGQAVQHDGVEIVDSQWLRPANALRLGESGEIKLPFPTTRTLQQIAAFETVSELMTWARKRNAALIQCVRPVVIAGKNGFRITIPGDPDYPGDDR